MDRLCNSLNDIFRFIYTYFLDNNIAKTLMIIGAIVIFLFVLLVIYSRTHPDRNEYDD